MSLAEQIAEIFDEAATLGRRRFDPDLSCDHTPIGSPRDPWEAVGFARWCELEAERARTALRRAIAERELGEMSRGAHRPRLSAEERRARRVETRRAWNLWLTTSLRAARPEPAPITAAPMLRDECPHCGAEREWRYGCPRPVVAGRMAWCCRKAAA